MRGLSDLQQNRQGASFSLKVREDILDKVISGYGGIIVAKIDERMGGQCVVVCSAPQRKEKTENMAIGGQ